MQALRHHDLGYTDVFVFENYLINQIKDGVIIEEKHYHVLKEMIDTHFKDRKMVYLSNRLYSYTVNPMVYKKVITIDNLLGMGIAVNNDRAFQGAKFEEKFFDKPYEVFYTMQEAIIWASRLIELELKFKD